MTYEQLKLSNQVCFPVYAVSRLIIRKYQPYLDALGITYPQYLVLLVLWETNTIRVSDIVTKIMLNTNTLTPILKRMEHQGLLSRTRSTRDERQVIISLTEKGHRLQDTAARIPEMLLQSFGTTEEDIEALLELKKGLNRILEKYGPA